MAQLEESHSDARSSSLIPADVNQAVRSLVQLNRQSSSISSSEKTSQLWKQVSDDAKLIADSLKTPELRTDLGETDLMESSGQLLSLSIGSSRTGLEEEVVKARTELLRLIGNMCFDNDPNRARAHSTNVPDSILELLSKFTCVDPTESNPILESSSSIHTLATTKGAHREMTMPELKFSRAAIGALLNSSLKYDPIRKELLRASSLSILIGLLDTRSNPERSISTLYKVGSWMHLPPTTDEEEWSERIELGSTTASWIMSILEDVLAEDKSSFPPELTGALVSILLSLPHRDAPAPPYYVWEPEESAEFLETDLEIMTLVASLLESTAIDLSGVKKQLAFSQYTPEQPLLSLLLDFIETATIPEAWLSIAGEEQDNIEKGFSMIKAAVVRAIIEAPNEDEVMYAFMKRPEVITRLVSWLVKSDRDDLMICASHMLAAIGRKDEHCIALVQQYGVAAPLATIAEQKVAQQLQKTTARPGGEVTQILFGIVSLLRHLSIPGANKSLLGETGIITTVSTLLIPTLDFISPLQNAAVGLLKHLTASNVFNSLRLLGAPAPCNSSSTPSASSPSTSSALDMLVALIGRTDDVRLRSEATRTLVNVVRSLFSTRVQSDPTRLAAASPITPTMNQTAAALADAEENLKRKGRPRVVSKGVVEALTEMIRLSEKYPMLINEAVVALTLVAGSGGAGALLVLEALTRQHAPNAPAESTQLTTESPTSPISPSRSKSLAITAAGDPSISAIMLSNWVSLLASPAYLKSIKSASPRPYDATSSVVRPEMIGNACALLITTLRGSEVAKATRDEIDQLRVIVLGPLKGASEALEKEDVSGGVMEALKRTVGRALEVVEF